MPGALRDHADGKLKRRVCAGETIVHEHVLTLPEIQHPREQTIEVFLGYRLVHRSPIHCRFRARLPDNVLVLGRTTRELARANHQGTAIRQGSLVPRIACSINCDLPRFQYSVRRLRRPWELKSP